MSTNSVSLEDEWALSTKILGLAEPKPGHNRALLLILNHNSPLQERCSFFARVLQKSWLGARLDFGPYQALH